jgi:hypothetical protein
VPSALCSFTSRWRAEPLRASPVRAALTNPGSNTNGPVPCAAPAEALMGWLSSAAAADGPATAVWRLRQSLKDCCAFASCKPVSILACVAQDVWRRRGPTGTPTLSRKQGSPPAEPTAAAAAGARPAHGPGPTPAVPASQPPPVVLPAGPVSASACKTYHPAGVAHDRPRAHGLRHGAAA